MASIRPGALLLVMAAAAACGGESRKAPACDALPSAGLLATFQVGDQRYWQSITGVDAMTAALALWAGESAATIPNGLVVCEPAPWNCGWSWHVDPASIEFAENTIEECDGRPTDLEGDCAGFGGRYCPWAAELVQLRDCRTDPACPAVPR